MQLHPTGATQIKTKFLGNAVQDASNANMWKSHGIHSQHLTFIQFLTPRVPPSLLYAEMSLLSKDLYYCPTSNEVDEKTVREDAGAFIRKLRLKDKQSTQSTHCVCH